MLTNMFIIGIIVVSMEIYSAMMRKEEMAKAIKEAEEEGYEVSFAW